MRNICASGGDTQNYRSFACHRAEADSYKSGCHFDQTAVTVSRPQH